MPDDTSADIAVFIFRKPHLRLQKFDWIWITLSSTGDRKETDSDAH